MPYGQVFEFTKHAEAYECFKAQPQATLRYVDGKSYVFSPSTAAIGHHTTEVNVAALERIDQHFQSQMQAKEYAQRKQAKKGGGRPQ